MDIIEMTNTLEFKIALMRNYITQAFIVEWVWKHDAPDLILNDVEIELTLDKVSANIINYIERVNIQHYGVCLGQIANARQLKDMLEEDFMEECNPQLSEYGKTVMLDIYERISRGSENGVLPVEASIQVLAGEIDS